MMFLFCYSYSQDTLKLDKKVEYFSISDTVGILEDHFFNIYTRAKYVRELIKFSDKYFKLEYCFYYDNKRYVHDYAQFNYKISNEEINIQYGSLNETWTYDKKSDTLYYLTRLHDGFYEKGFAKTLIPFEKTRKFYTYNNNGDTLWETRYSGNYYPIIKLYNYNISDTVYEFSEVDKKPKHYEEVNYSNIKIPTSMVNMPIWENYLDCSYIFLSAIINNKGYLQNIKFLRSCADVYFEQTALQELAKFGLFSPGTRNGKPVNVKINILVKFE